MDFSNFGNIYSCIREILPNIELPNYEVFDEIDKSWNITKEKYGSYLWPVSDVEHHKLYFHLIKNACDNKKMIIRNPMYEHYNQDEIISTDIHFMTNYRSDNDIDNIICNYYFEKYNIVLGLFLGTGMTGLGVTVSYIIYFNEKGILLFPNSLDIISHSTYFLPKIYSIIQNINVQKLYEEKPIIATIDGYNNSLFHTCCTFVNGIFIMDQIGMENEIDELLIGPNDPYLIEKYYIKKYRNINVIKGKLLNEFECKIRRGVLFKYTHFHLINKCSDFIKSYINQVMPISNTYKNEIEYIKNNFYPIFSINLRCITCQIKDQVDVISETINKLKEIYPNSFFLIGGFLGDYNEELINNQNIEVGRNTGSYSFILNEYQNIFNEIKNKLNHKDYKSLINLKINNVLEFVKNVNFSVNMNAGYVTIETILNNIQCLHFGTKWNDHSKRVFYISKENYKEPIYIDEPHIHFFNNGLHGDQSIYLPISCEISSETIVNIVSNYDKNNNFILTNNLLIKNGKNKMIYIAHRGNLNGPDPINENKPEYLLETIKQNFFVETDLWVIDNKLYLGHDEPQYEININFLLNIKDKLFCHCKNIEALYYITKNYPDIECFFHDKDDCVLTSKNNIWTSPGQELTPLSICVMPERVDQIPCNCLGVCTDYPIKYGSCH